MNSSSLSLLYRIIDPDYWHRKASLLGLTHRDVMGEILHCISSYAQRHHLPFTVDCATCALYNIVFAHVSCAESTRNYLRMLSVDDLLQLLAMMMDVHMTYDQSVVFLQRLPIIYREGKSVWVEREEYDARQKAKWVMDLHITRKT